MTNYVLGIIFMCNNNKEVSKMIFVKRFYTLREAGWKYEWVEFWNGVKKPVDQEEYSKYSCYNAYDVGVDPFDIDSLRFTTKEQLLVDLEKFLMKLLEDQGELPKNGGLSKKCGLPKKDAQDCRLFWILLPFVVFVFMVERNGVLGYKRIMREEIQQYSKNIEECEKQSSDYVLKSGKCYINQETKKTEEDCKKQSPDYVFKNGKCYIYLNNQKTK